MVWYNGFILKKRIVLEEAMKVQCVICDKIEEIDDELPLAKKLRNRPIHTYMCQACHDRIKERTEARITTGKFRLYRSVHRDDEW